MRPIGGELELKFNDFKVYFTDSGRSSLRLFLRSGDNRNKRYLLPNFFCEVIEHIFIEENIEYKFYNIFEDLTIDIKYINNSDYDVLYVINYFGKYTNLSKINLDDKVLIEDNVFFHDFINHSNAKKWYGFNSLRKISTLADGSLIKTNIAIDKEKILKDKPEFSAIKYDAKQIKYAYINNGEFEESDYLDKFQNAEFLLNNQKNIYSISNESIFLLLGQITEQNIRKKRFNRLKSMFNDYTILHEVDYYSFFIMKVDKRDEFRKKLMTLNIFLPVHWPKSTQDNDLYKFIISIPLFEMYSDSDFNILIEKIKEIL